MTTARFSTEPQTSRPAWPIAVTDGSHPSSEKSTDCFSSRRSTRPPMPVPSTTPRYGFGTPRPEPFFSRPSPRTLRAISLAADERISRCASTRCSPICIRSKILAIVLSQVTSHRRYHKTACHTATLCGLLMKHVSSPQEGLLNPLERFASLQNISIF